MRQVEAFFDFINERHRVYLRKQSGKNWPWSKNAILQKYKFTNVFRELDRMTIWLRENWRHPYADHPELWFAIAVTRTINWPDTLEEIGFPDPWDPDRVAKVIAARKARGGKVFSGAYQGAVSRKKGQPRGYYVVERLDKLFHSQPPLHKAKALRQAWNMLRHPGMGGFMAYEVVTDLRWTRYLRDAPDVMTWAHAGPGAKMNSTKSGVAQSSWTNAASGTRTCLMTGRWKRCGTCWRNHRNTWRTRSQPWRCETSRPAAAKWTNTCVLGRATLRA